MTDGCKSEGFKLALYLGTLHKEILGEFPHDAVGDNDLFKSSKLYTYWIASVRRSIFAERLDEFKIPDFNKRSVEYRLQSGNKRVRSITKQE
jgi:hypothetical protein